MLQVSPTLIILHRVLSLPSLTHVVGRATYGRLQFRAATPNNARVHPDQPNPNQQYLVIFPLPPSFSPSPLSTPSLTMCIYYRIVLSLVAKTATSLNFVFSKISPCFMVRGQNPGKFNQASSSSSSSSSKPLTPPTTIPKQEFAYPPPSPFASQQPQQQQIQLQQQHHHHQQQHIQQSFDNSPQQFSPNSSNLSPNSSNQSPTSSVTLSPLPFQNTTTTTTTSFAFAPVNVNPAQLPALAAHAPPSPQARGMKRPSALGDGEGWTNDQYGNVYTTGKVGINTKDPQEALSVQGNVSTPHVHARMHALHALNIHHTSTPTPASSHSRKATNNSNLQIASYDIITRYL